jgi:hypothetical protein
MANRDERCGINVLADLGREPRLEEGGAGVVRVVFEATRDSRYWKDALVYFTTDAKHATTATFRGFFDLVADEYHPSLAAALSVSWRRAPRVLRGSVTASGRRFACGMRGGAAGVGCVVPQRWR